MAVTPTVANDDDSPFYKIMEEKGKVWEKIAGEVGAKISGSYNANILEFEMTQKVNSHQLSVYGKRELTTVNNRGIFSEVLKLELNAGDIDREKFLKVGGGGFLNIFFNLSGEYRHKAFVDGYKVKYNSASVLEKVIKTKIFEISQVNRLSVGAEGLRLEVREIPVDARHARTIRDFWQIIN
ncbi:hypothetical protein [Pontibacter mangrovi]|uniref:Uncharacterized protein n=1 Tax=Pontibacter mangrovi TaxID=2589816 RepID=A0A501W0G4_9BACT|nr:hypothetical protein [Pontibacter mangrovi]TPE40257.1 hypothetical protein FJM65_20160 [Pontibacter mangrovi]